jgi:hypothetical protein
VIFFTLSEHDLECLPRHSVPNSTASRRTFPGIRQLTSAPSR